MSSTLVCAQQEFTKLKQINISKQLESKYKSISKEQSYCNQPFGMGGGGRGRRLLWKSRYINSVIDKKEVDKGGI